ENQWSDFGSRTLQVTKLPALPFDVTESLNQLRVNLSFCGSGIKSIMVTSSVPNEGKSFITINLWKMMARSGQRTLLIDADLRNSEMRSTYGITCDEKVKGIAYYLAGQAPLEQAIYSTNIPNGYMIPMASSVANPSILLESGRFVQMIEECSKEFDYILIDTPPIGSVADALNIATHCDGTVLVVHGGETPRKLVANSIQLLKRTGVPLLGLVLNRAEINNRAGGYYYRRYYRYGGYYYKKGYGHYGYGYGNADKKQQSKTKK
ncbi:MAG: CpsD/CapB family tyrosine-protein kinase, partial [Lachnospiraceae bacterium]|nr:CpsD/CapB family tyrosine-protein kinase [Lachnospiraceae bacterium]